MQCTAERYLQTSISGEWRHHWSIDRLRACDLSHMRFRQDSHYKHKVAFSILWLQNCCWRLMFCLRPVGTAVLQGLYGAHEAYCEEVFVQNKHSPVSSVRSTKRWGRGMLMQAGVKISRWQLQSDCVHEQAAKADCECPLYNDSVRRRNQICYPLR